MTRKLGRPENSSQPEDLSLENPTDPNPIEVNRKLNLMSATLSAIQDIHSHKARGAELIAGLERIAELGCELVEASSGLVFLAEQNRGLLRCLVSFQTHKDWRRNLTPEGEHPIAKIVAAGNPQIFDDYENQLAGSNPYQGEPIGSLLAYPVKINQDTSAVFVFFRQKEQIPFEPEDLDTLNPVVNQCAEMIELGISREKAALAKSQREALKTIGAISDAVLGVSDLIKSSLEICCQALLVNTGIIRLDDHNFTHGYSYRMGQALVDHILDSGVILSSTKAITDWSQHKSGALGDLAPDILHFGLIATLIVPLRSGNRERGLMIFAGPEPRDWSEEDIDMVELASRLICASAERIEVAQAFRGQQNLLRVLESTSNGLNGVRGYSQTMDMVGEGGMSLGKTYRAAMFMQQPNGVMYAPWMSGLSHGYLDQVVTREPREANRLFDIPDTILLTAATISPREAVLRNLLHAEEFHSIFLWPMVYDGKNIAVLACYYDSPSTLDNLDIEIMRIFIRQAASALSNALLYDQLENQYIQAAISLATAVDYSEAETVDHNGRLAQIARSTAKALGVSERELEAITWAAMVHDIGKAGVPKKILQKSEPLSAEEWGSLHQAPVVAEQYLKGIERFRGAARLVRHLRERYDGSGYPDHLRGTKIPIGARVLAVADAYQAMLEKRPYRDRLSTLEAVAELQKQAGTQFDPNVVQVFVRSANISDEGSKQKM